MSPWRFFDETNWTLINIDPFWLLQDLLTFPGDQLLVHQELVEFGVPKSDVFDEIINLKELKKYVEKTSRRFFKLGDDLFCR